VASEIGSVEEMAEKIKRFKSKGKALSECKFAFKMFSKQLYGRYVNNCSKESAVYGNWDINFAWRD
jgi:hypothetical protein